MSENLTFAGIKERCDFISRQLQLCHGLEKPRHQGVLLRELAAELQTLSNQGYELAEVIDPEP